MNSCCRPTNNIKIFIKKVLLLLKMAKSKKPKKPYFLVKQVQVLW